MYRPFKIGENEKGEPIFEKKYTYYTYNEVHTMCKNFAKNLHEKREELIFKDSSSFSLLTLYSFTCFFKSLSPYSWIPIVSVPFFIMPSVDDIFSFELLIYICAGIAMISQAFDDFDFLNYIFTLQSHQYFYQHLQENQQSK